MVTMIMKRRITTACLFGALGLATLFAPDTAFSSHVLQSFFEDFPREFWGGIQLIVALLIAAATISGRYLRTTYYLGAVVCYLWGFISLRPALYHESWSIIGVIIWVYVGTIMALGGVEWRIRPRKH